MIRQIVTNTIMVISMLIETLVTTTRTESMLVMKITLLTTTALAKTVVVPVAMETMVRTEQS